MEATASLAWVAQMQEAGIPVTYAYISDAHDGHGTSGNIHFAYGPGETGYVQQLHDYDKAFQKFFDRLAADGINNTNTLFVFTVDEGDHFVGDAPTPSDCDGVTTPCTYNRVGEINADLRPMVYTQSGDSTLFSVDSDDAPTVYVNGTSAQPIRGQTDPIVRNLEREMGQLSWLNPYTGVVENNIMVALADHTGMGDPPHGHSRSVPYADLHAVRRSKLVLLRHHQCDPTGHVPDGGRMCIHSGADESKLRLEPRRYSGRDRLNLGGLRRPGCRRDWD